MSISYEKEEELKQLKEAEKRYQGKRAKEREKRRLEQEKAYQERQEKIKNAPRYNPNVYNDDLELFNHEIVEEWKNALEEIGCLEQRVSELESSVVYR